MVGIAGTHTDDGTATEMVEEMYDEDWYETDVVEAGPFELALVHHGDPDANGWTLWEGDGVAGILFGVAPNRSELGWDLEELFLRVLGRPDATLSELDGPFSIACVDSDGRAVVATDRIGTRPVYYDRDGRFAFASEVSGVLAGRPDATLDRQAVSDLLLLGSVWGDRTLAAEVASLRPGQLLEFEDGESSRRGYWGIDYGTYEGGDYVGELFDHYRDALGNVASTANGGAGLWLSGGLDSRTMATLLRSELDSLRTFTYDRLLETEKIVGKEDPDLSPAVAEHLGLDNEVLTVDPARATEVLPRCVELVDGMIPWTTLLNLAATFELPDGSLSVMFEGSGQSELFGEDVWTYHLDPSNFRSPAEALLTARQFTDVGTVRSLLDGPVDPAETIREAVDDSDEDRFQDVVMDANNRNLLSKFQFLSNKVTRARLDSRTPFASGQLLEHLGEFPADYRMGTVPFTKGRIPTGYSKPKVEIVRRLDGGIDRIPYERTGLRPDRPYPLHEAGFVVENAVNQLASRSSISRWTGPGSAFGEFVLDPLEDAADRPAFDREAVEEMTADYEAGDDPGIHEVAAVTTVERWASTHLDGR